MAGQIEFKFPVISVLYELDTEDEDYKQKLEATVRDLEDLLRGDLSPYKSEGENTPVKLRAFTKRC